MTDPHADLRDRTYGSVFDGPGRTDSALRHTVAANADVPADLATLMDKIHRHAYKVTDEDLSRLRASYGDDELFEIVVSAALGASRNRLAAGLAALEEA
jgi:alkylhydroperoxidase family enzyme